MRHELIGFAVPPPPVPVSEQNARICRDWINSRWRRNHFFKSSLFSEPAWDILLQLFAADGEDRKLTVSAVARKSGTPMTTALRWIAVLQREGLIEREDDPEDGRRVFLTLSYEGFQAMQAYVEAEKDASSFLREIDRPESDIACNIGYGAAGRRG